MHAKTSGIILHQVKYSDKANIVSAYTREFGRVSYMVYGANRKKSATRAALIQPMSCVKIDASHHPRKEIQTLRELRIEHAYSDIPFNPVKNSIALFMSGVLNKTLTHPTKDEELYDFIEESIVGLDVCESGLGNYHLAFLAGLAELLGIAPQSASGANTRYFDMLKGKFTDRQPEHLHYLDGEAALRFRLLMQMRYNNLDVLPLTRKQRAESLDNIIEYFRLHLPDFNIMNVIEIMHNLWD